LGVLAAFDRPDHEPLSDERTRLLGSFAAQAALAIGRMRLAEGEERSRAAAESDRLKSTFLASVSHDLRTPLTAIKAAASGLRRGAHARGDTPHEDLAASIDGEVDRLNRLVGNLLEMSRIEAGGLPPQKTLGDIAEVAGTVVQRIQPLLGGRRLTAIFPPDLPLLPFDAAQVDRVLTNLLENAVKFSYPNSAVVLEAFVRDDEMRVRVHNDGPHIADLDMVRVFDKFYQAGNDASGARGTGLGLAISKGIVEAHGGRIWAENDPTGVRVTFALPLGVARADMRGAVGATS
jgi:two-component system sensor histidine kinase KdpD